MVGAFEARPDIAVGKRIHLYEVVAEWKVRFSEARRDADARSSPETTNQLVMLFGEDYCPNIILGLESSD